MNPKTFFQRIPSLLPILCALATALGPSAPAVESSSKDYTQEPKAERDARMKWFREARFGMFIHWGLYSQAAGEWNGKPSGGAGEWLMNDMQIPDSQYASLVPQFNPVKFDASQWVRIAKGAGMKYIVITSKHHDGFALYPSALTDWCIKSTPFNRDPLKELAAACKAEGVRFCLYHSIMDWHHPDYLPRKPWNDLANPNADFERYVAFMKGELKELLTGYGPIGLVWFDGNWEDTWTHERGLDLYNYVRSLQPNTIVNNRVEKGRVGDYGTPEQTIPANGYGPGVDWETCMTMNDTWGYKKQDHDWKSTQTLVRNLIDCASKGGNYLLNVGPTGEGLIPDASVERLAEVGKWMSENGEAIYATTASPFSRQLPWGRCTQKTEKAGTVLYLHVFDWPASGELLVPGLKSKVSSASLLGGNQPLKCQASDDGVTVSVPKEAPNAISSTVVLKVKGPLEVAPMLILQQGNGSVELRAIDAHLHGSQLRYESGGPLDNIGYWTNPEDWADWQFKVKHPGKFNVMASISAPASGSFEISLGGHTLHCSAPNTGNYVTFKEVALGRLEIPESGEATLSVKPIKGAWHPMNLKGVWLRPEAK